MDHALTAVVGLLMLTTACGVREPDAPDAGSSMDVGLVDAGIDAGARPDFGADPSGLPYAREVVRFEPGPEAGFGQNKMPEVVLGPPASISEGGSLDVVSLGIGGEIVLAFGDQQIVDGPGADFVVFENPFHIQGDPMNPFAELGEVSVSNDAVSWHTFPCESSATMAPWPGCAGWRVTRAFDPFAENPLVVDRTGGDPFDLAELGLSSARYVRIRDLATDGASPSAGFDLDAVGIIHAEAN